MTLLYTGLAIGIAKRVLQMDKILFFDGYCSLCDGLVDRMLHWDKKSVLKFASLQGETAQKLLPPERRDKANPDTIIYLRNGVIYDRSTAVLLSLYDIGGLWVLFSVFLLVPKFVRDLAYRFVTKIRYRVFGKRKTCRLPTLAERERLLP